MTRGTTRVYRGWLGYSSNGEEDDILTLAKEPPEKDERPWRHQPRVFPWSENDGFLSELVMDDMEEHGHYLSVRYYTSTQEATEDELAEAMLRTLYGEGDARYGARYSDITGYLWTDNELEVGGHDLMAELSSHAGRFLHMEITYNKEPLEEPTVAGQR